jgi:hypothetical protein
MGGVLSTHNLSMSVSEHLSVTRLGLCTELLLLEIGFVSI